MGYQSLGEMFFDKRQSMPDKVGYMFKKTENGNPLHLKRPWIGLKN